MINGLDVDIDKIHAIGHSLGGHLIGHFGRTIKKLGENGPIYRAELATRLRSVTAELTRAAELLEESREDTITFYDEDKGSEASDYARSKPETG